jgi:hypothetical protein
MLPRSISDLLEYRISAVELRCWPIEEMLLQGLGAEDAFGENGCEMTESWPRPKLDLL